MIRALLQAAPGGVFVDVGANVGQTLLAVVYSTSEARYIGVEPNPAGSAVIRDLIDRNQLANYEIHTLGLSDRNGALPLYLDPRRSTDTRGTLSPSIRPSRDYRSQTIEVQTFDDFAEAHVLNRVDVIKIDVEGSELSVLQGMPDTLSNRRPAIVCEVLLRDQHEPTGDHARRMRAISQLLRDRNYLAYPIHDLRAATSPIAAFPSRRWTWRDLHRCDYVFLPQERAHEWLRMIGYPTGHLQT